MERRYGKNFKKLVLSYLVVLALPLVVIALAVGSYMTTLRAEYAAEYAEEYKRRVEAMDDILMGFEHYANALSDNPTLQSLYNSVQVNAGVPAVTIQKNIPNAYSYSAINTHYVERMLIFFERNGLVIGKNGLYYTDLWTYDYEIEGKSLSEWQEITTIVEGSYCMMLTDNLGGEYFTYVTTLPTGYSTNPKASVVLLVKRERIDALLREELTDSPLVIRRSDGTKLIAFGSEEEIRYAVSSQEQETGDVVLLEDGARYTVFRILSTYNGWSYTWYVPTKLVEARINGMVALFLAIFAGLIFLGGCVAIYLAYLRNKPVKEIEGMLSSVEPTNVTNEKHKEEDEYDTIRKNLRVLIDRHHRLESLLQRNEELVRDSIVMRLLAGKSMTEREETLRERLGFAPAARYYTVILLRITDKMGTFGFLKSTDEEVQIQHSILTSFILESYPEMLVQGVEMNKIAMIYAAETDEACIADSYRYASTLLEKIMKKGHTNVAVGIGGSVGTLDELYQSYETARLVSGRMKPGEIGVRGKEDAASDERRMQYTLADEQRLISLVNRGASEECGRFLNMLIADNRRASDTAFRLFVVELIGTLHKIAAYRPQEQTIRILAQRAFGECDEGLLVELTEQFALSCDRAAHGTQSPETGREKPEPSNLSSGKGEEEALTTRITAFLEHEYANQALSLSRLGEQFDLSEAYLSHLFKQQTGENFSACLERIRMNRAHVLLSTTELPVDEIAEKIGYNSGDTFRRAFRRFHGITPGAYRNSTRLK